MFTAQEFAREPLPVGETVALNRSKAQPERRQIVTKKPAGTVDPHAQVLCRPFAFRECLHPVYDVGLHAADGAQHLAALAVGNLKFVQRGEPRFWRVLASIGLA